ncbi:hypothetical protein ACHWQZ_G013401 [Mnemiopsis leidyi]
MNNQNKHSQTKLVQYYDYCKTNIESFLISLKEKFLSHPPDDFSNFCSTFNDELDKAFKLEKPKCSKRTPLNNPWITFGLIKSINTKDELYESWKKAQKVKCVAPDTAEKPAARNNCDCKTCKKIISCYLEYKAHRQVLKRLINLAKKKFYSDKISEYSGDSKKLWEIINNIRGKSRHEIKPSFKLDDRKITERRLIANEFNKYFVSIATKLNKGYCNDEIPLEGLPSFTDYLPKSCPTSIYLSDCNQNEIMDIIGELKNGFVCSKRLIKLFSCCTVDHLLLGKNNVGLKDDEGNLTDGYFSLTNFPHGLQLTWVANKKCDITPCNSLVLSRGGSRGSENGDTEEIKIVLEWVKCVKTLDTLLDQHFLITNNNLQKMLFVFNKGGLERLTQVLRGWARVQKSEVAETPLDIRHARRLIYEGGVSDEGRGEIWRCLLSLHNHSHTHRQKSFRNQLLADKYKDIRLKVPDQKSDPEAHSTFCTIVSEIEKDCCRTDSHNPLISGADNPNQAALKRILINYYLHRPEMGYVQGMSDLLVPIFLVVREESEVFWCFDFFMNRSAFSKVLYCNLYQQLAFLREVLGLLFPGIYNYLSTTGDALTLTCCHRWFLLFFKREFDLIQLLKLWDVLLGAPSPFFQVFISAAMISLHFPTMIDQHLSATELLMESQKLAGTFDLDDVLKQARYIYQQIVDLPEVPCSLIPLVGGEGDYWDGFRSPNFTCLDCEKKGFCEMKRDYVRIS